MYLYDELRTPLHFSYAESDSDLTFHLLQKYNKKVVCLSHIESPFYLCIKRMKGPNLFNMQSLLPPGCEDFKLVFKRWGAEHPMSSNGLFLIEPSLLVPEQITLRHIKYIYIYIYE